MCSTAGLNTGEFTSTAAAARFNDGICFSLSAECEAVRFNPSLNAIVEILRMNKSKEKLLLDRDMIENGSYSIGYRSKQHMISCFSPSVIMWRRVISREHVVPLSDQWYCDFSSGHSLHVQWLHLKPHNMSLLGTFWIKQYITLFFTSILILQFMVIY